MIATTAQTNKAHHTGKVDAPDWVVTFGKSQKYPASRYLVGFGSSTGKGSEASQIAQRVFEKSLHLIPSTVILKPNAGL